MPQPFARTGAIGNYSFLAQWFPKLGVLQDAGWNCHQFHATTEFFSDYGVYDVKLTVPAGWIVGATGAQRSQVENADGTATHRYYQEDVHDFAWTTSPMFIEQIDRFEPAATSPDSAPQDSAGRVEAADSSRARRSGRAPLRRGKARAQGLLGMVRAYPYDHLTIVDPAFHSDRTAWSTRRSSPAARLSDPRPDHVQHAGGSGDSRSRSPILLRYRRNQRVRRCVDGRGHQHLCLGARHAAGRRRQRQRRRFFGRFVPWVAPT